MKNSTRILQQSKNLPQIYKSQTKEQWKSTFIEKNKLSIPTSKRSLLLIIDLSETEDSVEKLVKEELILALEATKINTIAIGENPHAKEYKYIHWVEKEEKKSAIQAADLYIWPEEAEEFTSMHFGTIVLSKEGKHIDQYDAYKEIGDGFVSKQMNHWTLFADIIRIEETFKFAYDWKHICQNAMDKSYEKLL